MRPFWVAIGVFGAMLGAILFSVMPHIGRFNYALDDAYIHLAVARNLAETGWFGVRPGEFVLLSSSPLFTTILALVLKISGPWEGAPLLVSSTGAILSLAISHAHLRPIPPVARTVSLLAIGATAMIVPLVTLGLEHTLHLAMTLLFARILVDVLVDRASPQLLAVAALPLVVLRYESLFLVATATVLLVWRKRLALAVIVAASAITPAAIVGFYSVAHGGTALPSSVLVKGGIPAGAGIGWYFKAPFVHFATNVKEAPHILGLIATIAILLELRRRKGLSLVSAEPLMGLVALGCMVCFMASSFAYGFYRYELWLVFLAGNAAVPMFFELRSHVRSIWLAAVWFPAMFAMMRAASWTKADAAAIRNIHDQQIVLGEFLARYHKGEPVVVNDIGYITWAATTNVVDYAGLATPEVTRAWRRGDFSMQMYDEAAKKEGARLAILFPNWYPQLPARFTPIASFTIPDNVCHNDTFVLYGLDPEMNERLAREAEAYEVPPAVTKKMLLQHP